MLLYASERATSLRFVVWNEPTRLSLIKKYYPKADMIVAVSQGVAEDLIKSFNIPKEKIQVIYNPITPEIFQKAKELLGHPWFGPNQPPVILAIGRFTKQKDFPTLLKAFALVRQQRKVRLLILGDGEERPLLEQLTRNLKIQNDVMMPGFTDNPYAFMKRAALFVLSSVYEGLPNVLIEAIALGCPVVSTDCPSGPREILDGGRYGRLVPVGDYEALANAILQTLDNRPDPKVLQQRAAQFSLENAVKEYLKVLGLE